MMDDRDEVPYTCSPRLPPPRPAGVRSPGVRLAEERAWLEWAKGECAAIRQTLVVLANRLASQ